MQEPPRIVVPPPGPRSKELAARLAAVESPSFDARRASRAETSGTDQAPIVYARAQGTNVFDVDDNRYVDLVAGFGALLLGHRPARVAAAVRAEEEKLWLALGDVYASEAKIALCERLARLYPQPGARVLLGLSGADAVTAALKTAALATGRSRVVAFHGSYHGLSHGPLAACGLAPGFREPFAEQTGGFVTFLPYGEATVDLPEDTAAVLVEPVLGRGGCVVPPAGFLRALRSACDARGALLIADEVWTGLGRAGSWLASLDEGVVPDVVCLGKGLGGGFPVSACIGSARAMAAWGAHGGATIHTSTHAGHPVGAAAALAVLDALEEDSGALLERVRRTGEAWRDELARVVEPHGLRVRGRGLMVGLACPGGARQALGLVRGLLGKGYLVLTGGKHGDVLTMTPPLDVEPSLLGGFTAALAEVL